MRGTEEQTCRPASFGIGNVPNRVRSREKPEFSDPTNYKNPRALELEVAVLGHLPSLTIMSEHKAKIHE